MRPCGLFLCDGVIAMMNEMMNEALYVVERGREREGEKEFVVV